MRAVLLAVGVAVVVLVLAHVATAAPARPPGAVTPPPPLPDRDTKIGGGDAGGSGLGKGIGATVGAIVGALLVPVLGPGAALAGAGAGAASSAGVALAELAHLKATAKSREELFAGVRRWVNAYGTTGTGMGAPPPTTEGDAFANKVANEVFPVPHITSRLPTAGGVRWG